MLSKIPLRTSLQPVRVDTLYSAAASACQWNPLLPRGSLFVRRSLLFAEWFRVHLRTALEILQDDSNLENAEDIAAAAAAAFRSSLTRATSQPVEDDLPEEEAEEGEIEIPVRRSFTS
eukprot:COSAG02_NODE_17977_length_968_cov_0.845800_3_plen_118_part_00